MDCLVAVDRLKPGLRALHNAVINVLSQEVANKVEDFARVIL